MVILQIYVLYMFQTYFVTQINGDVKYEIRLTKYGNSRKYMCYGMSQTFFKTESIVM